MGVALREKLVIRFDSNMDKQIYIFRYIMIVLIMPYADGVITNAAYQKSYLSEGSTSCELATHSIPSKLFTSKVVYCSTFCTDNPNCAAYCIQDNVCLLIDLMVSPGSLPQSEGGMESPCYVPFDTNGQTTMDLLRGKTVIEQGSWDGAYASVHTVVTGARCEKKAEDCFCTTFKLWPNVVVDMETSQAVATVVVTVSSFYPDYFQKVEVRVGSSGSRDDDLLTTYTGSANKGERLILKGSQTLTGRYVSLWRSVFLADSLCLCLFEAYAI